MYDSHLIAQSAHYILNSREFARFVVLAEND